MKKYYRWNQKKCPRCKSSKHIHKIGSVINKAGEPFKYKNMYCSNCAYSYTLRKKRPEYIFMQCNNIPRR